MKFLNKDEQIISQSSHILTSYKSSGNNREHLEFTHEWRNQQQNPEKAHQKHWRQIIKLYGDSHVVIHFNNERVN